MELQSESCYFDKSIGRWKVNLRIKGKMTTMNLSRYLMCLKLGRMLKRHEAVHHKDENKLNDSMSNLEIMSSSDHMRHHIKHKGAKHPIAKLNDKKVKQIRVLIQMGFTQTYIGNQFDVHQTVIRDIKAGKIWRHVK